MFSSKTVPLQRVLGRRVAAFLSSLRSDQLCLVCASDLTSKDCRLAEGFVRQYLAQSLNRVLDAQSLCASKADLSGLLNQSDCQVILADCLSDRTLSKRFGFHILPMYMIFFGRQLVFISNRLANRAASVETMEVQVRDSLVDARSGRFLPPEFRFPSLGDSSFSSIS
jgi:hypothetical protein